MNMNCNIAGDLLPLYVDGACSPDSRKALEEHLAGCPACRERLERMRKADITPTEEPKIPPPRLKTYAKKVRWRRFALGIGIVLLFALALVSALALEDMNRLANPTVFDVEEGTVNLSAGSMTTMAQEVGRMLFYTNYECIQVTVEAEGDFAGEVTLWHDGHPIQFLHVDSGSNTCTFTGLTAAFRYEVHCEGLEGAVITVSDGRVVNFWQSVKNVLKMLL